MRHDDLERPVSFDMKLLTAEEAGGFQVGGVELFQSLYAELRPITRAQIVGRWRGQYGEDEIGYGPARADDPVVTGFIELAHQMVLIDRLHVDGLAPYHVAQARPGGFGVLDQPLKARPGDPRQEPIPFRPVEIGRIIAEPVYHFTGDFQDVAEIFP